ncbi:type IV secretory pathway VirB10-like protein [Bradyrhizobium barranii subsp. barranii]
MKAALEAWGASSNLFHQGAAKETDDPDIVAATMASPGVVLRRPVGSGGPFTESAALPTDLADGEAKPKSKSKSKPKPESKSKSKQRPAKGATKQSRKIDDQDARKAAAAFEKEERRRDAERRKEEAALAKERAKQRASRGKAVAAAQAALDNARRGARREGGGDRSRAGRARRTRRGRAGPVGQAKEKARGGSAPRAHVARANLACLALRPFALFQGRRPTHEDHHRRVCARNGPGAVQPRDIRR